MILFVPNSIKSIKIINMKHITYIVVFALSLCAVPIWEETSMSDDARSSASDIQPYSGILAPLVQLGYGAYNITNNNKYKGAALSAATLYLIQVCPTLGLPAAAYVMNGEDKLTQLCIDWGYNHYGRK